MDALPNPYGFFGRRVARLPASGVLIAATDLQGNYRDYLRLKAIYAAEEARGNHPMLLLLGDIVHGPAPELLEPGMWPEHLGSAYPDQSAELVLDYMRFAADARTVSLLGNHEHAHIGGPIVAKFHPDEAAVLDHALGPHKERVHAFFRSLPLVAVARCGAVFTHGAPRATEPDLASFERIQYDGYEEMSIGSMYERGTLGALLWARGASPTDARALLAATSIDGKPNAFVGYGHDVVPEGYEKIGAEQICFSTSYGVYDENKVYLRLDLTKRYASVDDLHDGVEILPLYPKA